jgi:hypothetical protein
MTARSDGNYLIRSLNYVFKNGDTCMHKAVLGHLPEFYRYLLKKGLKCSEKNKVSMPRSPGDSCENII